MNLKFYKTVVFRVTALVMAMVSGCVSLKLYSHYLTPDVYGVIVVALQILSYMPLMDGGFRTTTNREILATATRDGKLALIRFAQTFYSRLSLVLLPVALVAMGIYSLTPHAEHAAEPRTFFLTMGITAIIALLAWAQIELLVGVGEQSSYFLMNATNSCVMLGTLWICLHFQMSVWAFPLSTLMGVCVCYPVALWLIRQKEPAVPIFTFQGGPDFWSHIRRLWRNAWECFRMQLSLLFLYTWDIVLVGLICARASDAGIYGIVSRVIALVRSLLGASGEAAWPIVAQKNKADHVFAAFLLRSNGWAIGSASGALLLTLKPFLTAYMGPQWSPPQLLVVILTARLLLTGLSSPAGYLLQGAGNFKTIGDYALRELVIGTLLGGALGIKFGMIGVAGAFLVATLFGDFYQIYFAYAKSVKASGIWLMWQAYWRGLLACAISAGGALLLIPYAHNTVQIMAVGAASALSALSAGVLICVVRVPEIRTRETLRARFSGVMTNI